MKRHLSTGALSVALIAWAGAARADDRVVAPPPPRVIHAPTANLQPSMTVFGSAGVTQHGFGLAALTTGLGQLAEVAVSVDDDVAACAGCSTDAPTARSLLVATAQLKIGVNEGRVAPWQPAVALGFRRSVGSVLGEGSPGDFDALEVGRLYAAASKTIGPVRVHVGVDVWDTAVTLGGDTTFLHDRPLAERVRPFAAVAFTSPQTPRTSLMTDVVWTPVVDAGDAALRYVGGLGVRYQAFDWASIELGVRHRDGDGLDDTTFMVRINAIVPPPET